MKLNDQPIEKRVDHPAGLVDVHSIFLTIQGEGPFCGTPCVFVRLAGCNLQCPACDTEYTQGRQLMGPGAIVAEINELWRPDFWRRGLVVITGGEPYRQNLTRLLELLEYSGYYVQVETNGTLPPSPLQYGYQTNIGLRAGVYIVCSPKSGKVNLEVWLQACCAKYVLEAGNMLDDGLPATALMHSANPHVARPPDWWDRPTYLQPMDAKDPEVNQANIVAVRDSCMKHGHIMQLQIHKIIGVE